LNGATVSDAAAGGYAVCGELYQTIFETAWLMRGMQTFLTDFYLEPEIAHAICERIVDIRVRQARHFAQAGVDIIRLGDDIVTQRGRMMSAEIYREFIQPGVKRIVAAAKAVNPEVIIFMHCCGRVEDVIDDLIDAGIEVLNPVQPECNDLRRIKAQYGDRLSFCGAIDTGWVLPHGTPADVRAEVRRRIRDLGPGGGYILASVHCIQPDVPLENVIAMLDEAKIAGRYPLAL